MTEATSSRRELKRACLALLDERAVEHPAGHQAKLAARYVLRRRDGERIGLMFEKGDSTDAHLWVGSRFAEVLLEADIEGRVYPASALYAPTKEDAKPAYGRHSGLKAMRDLANADLVRFTLRSRADLVVILDHLA